MSGFLTYQGIAGQVLYFTTRDTRTLQQVNLSCRNDGETVPVPRLLLLMLIFWLTVLFVSFGLFGPRSVTVPVSLLISGSRNCRCDGNRYLQLKYYGFDVVSELEFHSDRGAFLSQIKSDTIRAGISVDD